MWFSSDHDADLQPPAGILWATGNRHFRCATAGKRPQMENKLWESQQRHIPCLQDLEGVQLYTKTGTKTKGGIELPVYHCARASTSLESFHQHLNNFIPGKLFFYYVLTTDKKINKINKGIKFYICHQL